MYSSSESLTPHPVVLHWKEAVTPEGRKYWYNTITQKSTYEKPDELLLEEEKAFQRCPWKEYTSPDGKKYYAHARTKETTWQMPEEFRERYEAMKHAVALEKEREARAAKFAESIRGSREQIDSLIYMNTPPPTVEFATQVEAEEAFCNMLKEKGIRPGLTWEDGMRIIINEPMYRALKSVSDRKRVFQEYVKREESREQEEKMERDTRQHKEFMDLLEATSSIKSYTRFRTALKLLGDKPAFSHVEPDRQRAYFIEYVQGLKKVEKERSDEMREKTLAQFQEFLQSLPDITYKTKWKDAKKLYSSQPGFDAKDAFSEMQKVDFLETFENYSKKLWEEPDRQLHEMKRTRLRKERLARDGFKTLLGEMRAQHLINARTLWKQIYAHIKDEPRFSEMLGLSGSTPQDLFFDMIDDLQRDLHDQKREIYHVLKKHNFEVEVDTSFDAYSQILSRDQHLADRVSDENIKLVFDHLKEKAQQAQKRQLAKELTKKMDVLRHAMKNINPPINVDDTWNSVRPRIEELPEYKNLEVDSARLEAFEKYIRRLKEKQGDPYDDEDEEGMIREDEEPSSRSRRSRSRRDSDHDSDYESADRSQKRRKRHESRSEDYDYSVERDLTNIEEGEALDEYEKDSRRKH